MPLYEFRCKKCDQQFEKIVFAGDQEPIKCPRCGAPKPDRLLSVFSSSTRDGNVGATSSSSCGPSRGFS
jgi:putative FmdB family regulatory protein